MANIDKIASGYNTDKGSWPAYLSTYEHYLADLRRTSEPICLFEMGVKDGGSLQLWRDYLPNARVVGLDLELPPPLEDPSGRIRMYAGAQDDESLLRRIATTEAPGGFDVIIDDCAHRGHLALASFRVLFPLLKPGGLYFIEDWGAGYWPDWFDGARFRHTGSALSPFVRALEAPLHRVSATQRNVPQPVRRVLDRLRATEQSMVWRQHTAGMVGFVKMLVDEVAAADVTRGGGSPELGAPIEGLTVRAGVAIVRKADGSA